MIPRATESFREACVIRTPLDGRVERRSIELRPQRPSKPFALLAWGYRPESTIHSILVGFEEQLVAPVAGSVFSSLLDYEEFERLLDRRVDGHDAVRALWRLFRYSELDIATANLGTTIIVELSGPFEQLVFLATMPDWQSWDGQFRKAAEKGAAR